MEIIPQKISLNRNTLMKTGEEISNIKHELSLLKEDIVSANHNLYSVLLGNLKPAFKETRNCVESSISRILDTLGNLSDSMNDYVLEAEEIDKTASFNAEGTIDG